MLIAYPWEPPRRAPERGELTPETTFFDRVRAWLTVIAAVGVVQAFYGTYQVVARYPHIYWLQKTVYVDSATGTFVNRSHLAGYLELAIPSTIALALLAIPWQRTDRRRRRHTSAERPARGGTVRGVLLLAAVATMLVVMGLTKSRGGVLSSLGGLAVGALLFGIWRRQLTWSRVAIGAAALGALAWLWLQSPQLVARFAGETRLTPYSRPSLWRETVVMARDFPLFGIGLGNFEWLFPRYQPEGTRTYFDRAHNDYLQLLVEAGLLGTLCFAWLFAKLVVLLRRRLRVAERDHGVVALGLTTGIVALLWHSFTDFNLHIPANALTFVFAVAIIVRLLDRGSGAGLQGWVPLTSRAVALTAIAAAVLAMMVAVRNYAVERVVREIFPNSTLFNPRAGPADPLPVRVRRVARAHRVAPGQVEVVEAIGTFALHVAQQGMRERAHSAGERSRQLAADAWAAAVRGFQRMVELRPSAASAHLHLGEAIAGLGEVAHGATLPPEVMRAVSDEFERGVWLQPRDRTWTRMAAEWGLTHWGRLSAGDQERAAKWVRQALALDPERGRELLRMAIAWDPTLPARMLPPDPAVRLYLAMAYKDSGDPDEALRVAQALDADLTAALRSNAASFVDARLLGRVREFRGDARGAADGYGRASVLADSDTDRAEMLKRAGYNWLGAGDLDRALQALSGARRYGRRDPDVLAGMSAVYERRKDFVTAARLVRDAVAVAPNAPEYRYRLARLYEGARDYGKANEQYRRLLDDNAPFAASHRTDILLALARNYRQLELSKQAREYYQQVLERDPQNGEAREFLSYFGS